MTDSILPIDEGDQVSASNQIAEDRAAVRRLTEDLVAPQCAIDPFHHGAMLSIPEDPQLVCGDCD